MATNGPGNLAPLWVPEHDYLPEEDRSALRTLRPSPGVVSFEDFRMSPTTPTTWNILVGPGRAVVDGNVSPWTQGSYICYSPESQTIEIEPSNPSLVRFDLIVIHVHDQDNSHEEGYSWNAEAVTGIPGAPTPPDPPDNCLVIGALRIPAGSTSVTADMFGYPDITGTWQVQQELRRPIGPVLMYQHWRVESYLPASWGGQTALNWDLRQPNYHWQALRGWPFLTFVEFEYTGMIWSQADGWQTLEWIIDGMPYIQGGSATEQRTSWVPGGLNWRLTWSFKQAWVIPPNELPRIRLNHYHNPGTLASASDGYCFIRIYPLWPGANLGGHTPWTGGMM